MKYDFENLSSSLWIQKFRNPNPTRILGRIENQKIMKGFDFLGIEYFILLDTDDTKRLLDIYSDF